jgi:hypothetical protein
MTNYYDKYVTIAQYFVDNWTTTPVYMKDEIKDTEGVTEFITLDNWGKMGDNCLNELVPNQDMVVKVGFYSNHKGKVEKLRSDFQLQFSGVAINENLTIGKIILSENVHRLEDDLFEGFVSFTVKE